MTTYAEKKIEVSKRYAQDTEIDHKLTIMDGPCDVVVIMNAGLRTAVVFHLRLSSRLYRVEGSHIDPAMRIFQISASLNMRQSLGRIVNSSRLGVR